MNKFIVIALTLIASLSTTAVSANPGTKPQTKPASNTLVKMDNLGGGNACQDGKCGKNQQQGQTGNCCCARMGSHGGDMSMRDHGAMYDDTHHEDMMKRMRSIEERLEHMHRLLQEQKTKG